MNLTMISAGWLRWAASRASATSREGGARTHDRKRLQAFTAHNIDGNQVGNCPMSLPEREPLLGSDGRTRSHLSRPKMIDTERKTTPESAQIRHPEIGGFNSDLGVDLISMWLRCQQVVKVRHLKVREAKCVLERRRFRAGLVSKKGSKIRFPSRRGQTGSNTP